MSVEINVEMQSFAFMSTTFTCMVLLFLAKNPKIMYYLSVRASTHLFNFQRALNIEAIYNETKCLDRKSHLLREIPVIDAKFNELMGALSYSGDAYDWGQ